MKNIGNLMKQAQEMQTKMMEAQKKLETLTVEGSAGGGMVKVTATCRGHVKAIKIDPSLLDPKEGEIVEDLIVAALNDAQEKADTKASEEMTLLTGGLQLPGGLKLPF